MKYARARMIGCLLVGLTVRWAIAGCPSADVTGDCRVDLDDFAVITSGWLTEYDANDLTVLGSQWLDDGAFITTWDTTLGVGTKVPLALAGTVDAVIDWGDGTVENVTGPRTTRARLRCAWHLHHRRDRDGHGVQQLCQRWSDSRMSEAGER